MRFPKRLLLCTGSDGLDDVLARLRRGVLAVDTETSGLDWTRDLVGGIGLAAHTTAVFFTRGALAGAARWLGDQVKRDRELVFHNAKFDMHFLRGTFGLHIPYPVHDTRTSSFLLDNRGAAAYRPHEVYQRDHHLKSLAATFLFPEANHAQTDLLQAIREAGGNDMGDWLLAPAKIAAKYSALDPWFTLQLHKIFHQRILDWRQPGDYPSLVSLYNTERWLLLALRDMEERGILIDQDYLARWGRKLKKKLERQLAILHGFARNKDMNWNSAPQIRSLIYSTLKQPCTRYTEGGEPSTDEVALLTVRHPVGRALLDYRETFKQYTSYAVNLVKLLGPDGAIHPTFNADGAETGRLSCKEPNLQQQTRESGVRRAYVPRPGLVLRFADYSQVEMRLASHAADEETFIDGYCNDPDFDAHGATAQKMYGVKEPEKEQRKYGKIINFTTLYGGGENQVTNKLKELLSVAEAIQGLRQQGYKLKAGEDPHRALAQLIRARYFRQLPKMKEATRKESDLAKFRGYVMNDYGRHRYLEGEKWYRAFNTRIQGTAADQAKRGLVALYRELQLRDRTIGLMLQIHDEAVYESDGDPRTDKKVLELLEERRKFKVPIIADVAGSDVSWQDKKKIELS